MPPPAQGEVTIRTFKGMDHKMAIESPANSASIIPSGGGVTVPQVASGEDGDDSEKNGEASETLTGEEVTAPSQQGLVPTEPGAKINPNDVSFESLPFE